MADSVKLPVIGEVPKRTLVIVGGVGLGITAVIVLRSRASAAGTAVTPDTSGDTSGDASGDTSGDDGSGYYLDGGADTGGGGAYDYGAAGTGYDAAGFPLGSQADVQWEEGQSGITGTAPGTAVTTNSQWVTEALGNVPGDQGTVRTALTSVLAGLTVTTAQKDLFLEAVALNQQPPAGYPTPIKTSDTAGHPGGTGGPDPKVKVPVVTGETIADATRELAAVGLKTKAPAVPHGKTGLAKTQSPKAGTVVNRNSTVTLTAEIK